MRVDRSETPRDSSFNIDARRDALLDASALQRARRKFLKFFPGGFRDDTYLAWERDYKWNAHQEWEANFGHGKLRRMLRQGQFVEIASSLSGSNRGAVCYSHLRRWHCAMQFEAAKGPRYLATGWQRSCTAPRRCNTASRTGAPLLRTCRESRRVY